MAAIDFPASPTVNQIFTAGNGASYQWTGTLWLGLGATQAMYIGDTAPSTPFAGQMWWNSTLGALFVYYADGNTTQWVPANPTIAQPPPNLAVSTQIGTGVITSATTLDVTWPTVGTQALDIDFSISNTADNSLVCYFMRGGALLNTANYDMLFIYNSASAATPNGVWTASAVGWGMGSGQQFSGQFRLRQIGAGYIAGFVNYHQSSATTVYGYDVSIRAFPAGAVADGFRFGFSGGTIGGYCHVWLR